MLHVRNPKSNRRNLFNRHRHASSLPWQINPPMGSPYLKAIFKSLKMQNIFPMFIATSDIDHDKQLGQIVVAWNGKGLLVSQPSRFDRTDALVI